jgi:hypothetical protein
LVVCVLTLFFARQVDFAGLLSHMQKNLPKYAIPLFLRFLPVPLDVTSTFKHVKVSCFVCRAVQLALIVFVAGRAAQCRL